MQELVLKLKFSWQPVLSDDGVEYFFPEKPTLRMRKLYRCPAIYRWNIYKSEPEDLKLFYIGETVNLCPSRLSGYLKPGPTQPTNKRINRDFHGYLIQGWKIRLETLALINYSVNEQDLLEACLADNCSRRAIEQLMIATAKHNGFKLLNY